MFKSPVRHNEVPCSSCISGPESCTCSGAFTCSINSNQLLDMVFSIRSETYCAELCYGLADCMYYSWYSPDNTALKEACAFLRDCEEPTGSETCRSGPSDCSDIDNLDPGYPQCFNIGSTWTEDTLEGIANIASAFACQELCQLNSECSSFTWFNDKAAPFKNFCELYPNYSQPTTSCSDCVSGPSKESFPNSFCRVSFWRFFDGKKESITLSK